MSGVKDTVDKTIDDLFGYVDLKIASIKLSLVESLGVFLAKVIKATILLIMCIVAFVFIAVVLFNMLEEWLDSIVWAGLIIAALCLLVGFAVYLQRNLFVNKMIKLLSRTIFIERKHKNEEEYGEEFE